MRALRLLALLCAAGASTGFAQEQDADAPTVLIEQAIARGTPAGPLSVGETYGAVVGFGLADAESLAVFALRRQGNGAFVRQSGVGNTAIVEQRGVANLAVILQQGEGNTTSTLQIGRRNVIGIRLRGAENQLGTDAEVGVEQVGTGNLYLLDLVGDGRAIAPTVQVGNGNQVVQIGAVAAPFGVQQFGDGMRMIIRHNGAR